VAKYLGSFENQAFLEKDIMIDASYAFYGTSRIAGKGARCDSLSY
jgi:hypothetical protein